MEFLIKLKKRIIKSNKDLIYLYRFKIYTYRNRLIKNKIIRYALLLKLFFYKYILRKDLYKEINKIKNTIASFHESKISKRRNLSVMLKSIVEKEVFFIDILDVLIKMNITDISLCKKNKQTFDVNEYGKIVYDVLEQNKKEIVLILREDTLLREIEDFLNNNGITKFSKIIICSKDIKKRNQELKEKIEEDYKDKTKFVYIGEYFLENISDKDKDLIMIPYESCMYWGEKFRPESKKSPQISIYSAIINNKLHEGIIEYNKNYEFGFTYGGIITYYVFTQMAKNKESFNNEYEKFKNKLLTDFKLKDYKFLEKILEKFFPKIVNNFIYDGTEDRTISDLENIKLSRDKKIQQGIMDFCKIYEEKLLKILEQNDISYEDLKQVIEFMINNKKKLIRRKI